ncbi:MAG: choice-of-anchor X domain-containing protein [bacterium]|nr:hypothetical protein [Candidatus Sumerlaeota bacterium]
MRFKTFISAAMALAVTCVTHALFAVFPTPPLYVTGIGPVFDPAWSPGTPEYQMTALGDGIFYADITAKGQGGGGACTFEWKAVGSSWSDGDAPQDNATGVAETTGSVIRLLVDTVARTDGFLPNVGEYGARGVCCTEPSVVYTTDVVRATGNFISELGGTNWDASSTYTVMYDDGTHGDEVAGDSTYTLAMSGLTAGNYEFKISFSGEWNRQISTTGFTSAGGNIPFKSLGPADNLKILADVKHGRTKIVSNMAVPGPPFYGVSAAWGLSMNSSTVLFDDGTCGDVTAGDKIYSRAFAVNAPTQYTLKAQQGVGPEYPGTGSVGGFPPGGYPFETVTTGQIILMQFDTNVLADSYVPNTRYVWTDPVSRRIPPYVQAIGDFMIDLGGAGNWNNSDPNFQLLDNGLNGDVVAGDNIFAATFANPAGVPSRQYKAIGLQGSWEYQFGGAGDGYTRNGNNPTIIIDVPAPANVIFQTDATTGRIGIGGNLPTRPPTINAQAPTDVADWMLY